MEPVSTEPKTKGRKGSLSNPEVYENVPGYIIPILEQEFDDFDNEAEKFLDGQTEENEFIGFRLKQGVYGQRQADVQMCRIKLPMGGVTPEQMETFADVVEEYAPLNKGHVTTRQNIQIHHIPLRQMAELIRKISRLRPVLARGLRQHRPQRHRRSLGRRQRGRAVRHHPVRGRVRALLRAPPHDAADAAQGQDGLHRNRRGPRDHRHPRHRLHPARSATASRGFEVRVGGGTSIMPRVAPTLYEFVEADNGDYLKVSEAVFRIFDRQDWLRVNRARARIKVLRRQVSASTSCARRSRRSSRATGSPSATSTRARCCSSTTRRRTRRRPDAPTRQPNGDLSEFERFRASNVTPQRQAGLLDGRRCKITRGDLTPGAVPRPRGDHARVHRRLRAHDRAPEPGAALGPRRVRLRRLDARSASSASATPAPTRSPTSSRCPGTDSCKLGITSSMGLNAAVKERIDGDATSRTR